jgi:acyl-CoA synthetase (AMP-forming)/AMP-acid ligase II
MLGVKMVFPGPHLHPDDLLDLMQIEPPTLSLGVPTIWIGLIQAYERALAEQPGRWKLPAGMRSLVGGAAVPEAAVIALRDEKWGERPLGCIVLKAGQAATAEQLADHLLKRGFAKWQLPDRYETLDAIPRTSTGKFWKLKLRERFSP